MARPAPQTLVIMALVVLLLLQGVQAQESAAATAPAGAKARDLITLDALMPPLKTEREDEYLCTAVQLPAEDLKLVTVEALADQGTVHHMLLFGCKEPAKPAKVWPCRMAPACGKGGENVLYGWGKNAPAVRLPSGTGFSVGPGTATRTVVLQVHYLQLRPENDTSGVRLHFTRTPVPYSAGLVAFASGFEIPPGKQTHRVPNECCYSGFETLRAFAFRVHTHALGRSVHLEQRGPDDKKGRRGRRVAEKDPQEPQGFYGIDPSFLVRPGDTLRATCEFNSTTVKRTVSAGHTSADEMCNLYLMLQGELPFFMWCVDGSEWIHASGAGGVPDSGKATPEKTTWVAPKVVDSIAMPSLESGEGAADGKMVKMAVGQVAGVAADENATVWAFHRAFRTWSGSSFNDSNHFTKEAIRWPAVLRLDRDSGAVKTAWGNATFFMPHMISVGPQGEVWVVDTGLHQVLKFTREGKQLAAFGQRLQPGTSLEPLALCKPTHAVSGRDGTLYIADGYCNSRVVVVPPKGKATAWLLPKARKGGMVAPLPHSLALDECRRRLYVTDREVGRIHAFDLTTGAVEGTWEVGKRFGLPYAIRVGPYGTPLVLAWDRDGEDTTKLVALSTTVAEIGASWELEGVSAPHDFTVVPAPLVLTGARDRLLAVLVAETAAKDSTLRKFVINPDTKGGGTEKIKAAQQEQQQTQHPAGLAASHAGHAMLKPVEQQQKSGGKEKRKVEEKKEEKKIGAGVKGFAAAPPSPKPMPSPSLPYVVVTSTPFEQPAAKEGEAQSLPATSDRIGGEVKPKHWDDWKEEVAPTDEDADKGQQQEKAGEPQERSGQQAAAAEEERATEAQAVTGDEAEPAEDDEAADYGGGASQQLEEAQQQMHEQQQEEESRNVDFDSKEEDEEVQSDDEMMGEDDAEEEVESDEEEEVRPGSAMEEGESDDEGSDEYAVVKNAARGRLVDGEDKDKRSLVGSVLGNPFLLIFAWLLGLLSFGFVQRQSSQWRSTTARGYHRVSHSTR